MTTGIANISWRVATALQPSYVKGAAICLARMKARSCPLIARRLTARANGAQHSEKAPVFYYSKVKEEAFCAPFGGTQL